MLSTTSSVCLNNEHQHSVNNSRPCTMHYHGAMWLQSFIIEILAAFLHKNPEDKSVSVSQSEHQHSINKGWLNFPLPSCIIKREWNADNPQWTYRQQSLAKMLVMISHPPSTVECPLSINSVCGGSECYTAIDWVVLFLNRVLHGESLRSLLL